MRTKTVLSAVVACTVLSGPALAQSIRIAWEPSAQLDIVGYVIHYGTESRVYSAEVEVPASTTDYEFTNLTLGTRYYFAVRAKAADGAFSALSNEVSDFPPVPRPAYTEFDGDGRAEIVVWRPGDGTWYILESGSGYAQASARNIRWGSGALGDIPMAADYDGDGGSDPAVWRPTDGTWYVLTSISNFRDQLKIQWGSGSLGDVPLAGDYDGDGMADFAVWRPGDGIWYVLLSSTGYSPSNALRIQWGAGRLRDVPVSGDFDGDSRADLAVWRPGDGVWWVLTSTTNYVGAMSIGWGAGSLGDVPVSGDYDGDGRTDLTVWRPGTGTWYVLTSGSRYTGSITVQWGSGAFNDVPVSGDYDGDHRSDVVVWRPGEGRWYVRTSRSSYSTGFAISWGTGALADRPVGEPTAATR